MENNVNQIELRFQCFFISSFPKIKNYAQLLLKSEVDAEDAAQDIFYKLWLQSEMWPGNEDELDNYLFIVIRNIILNTFKHQQTEREYQEGYLEKAVLHELIEREDALNNVYYGEMLLVVRPTLGKIPEQQRLIFELSRFEGLSYKEIAEKLNIFIRTMEHQVYLALIELRKVLLFLFFLFSFKQCLSFSCIQCIKEEINDEKLYSTDHRTIRV